MASASQAQCWNNRGWQAPILPSSKPWLSRSCRLAHCSHPNLFLDHGSVWSSSPGLLRSTPETQRRTPLSEGYSLRGIISSRIAYYQRQSGNHHLYCIWQCVLVDGKLGGYSEDRTFLPLGIMSSHDFRRRLARSIGWLIGCRSSTSSQLPYGTVILSSLDPVCPHRSILSLDRWDASGGGHHTSQRHTNSATTMANTSNLPNTK